MYPPPPVKGGGAAFRPLSIAREETHCQPHRYLWPSAGAGGPPIPSSLPVGGSGLPRPPIHIPTTFRYIFVRNRLSSNSPARYVTACASFSTSQPLSIGWSNVTFFSIVRGKATSRSRILYLVQTRNKGGFSMYIGLGTKRKERG